MKKILYLAIIPLVLLAIPNKEYVVLSDINSWDEHIREIGNVIETDGKYLLYYSGHTGENVRGKNDVYVGVAESADLKNWTKLGKVFNDYAEDPFVTYCKGSYWMFYEDKIKVPDNSISLAKSSDGLHFTTVKRDIISPVENSFQSRDTSSPVAVCLKDKIVVLYEARTTEKVGATLGYAESTDFIHWKQLDYPIATLGKERFIVPDDIKLYAGKYYLTFHDVDELMSVGRTDWKSKILTSKDLKTWELVGSINRKDQLMYLGEKYISYDRKGIFTTH